MKTASLVPDNDAIIANEAHTSSNVIKKGNANVLLFGGDLDKQVLDEPLNLSSDQDSTGGEEDDVLEEDISKLDPNLLLYKAAAAHNLPVMGEALALGADKLWKNTEDKGRSPIHQAVISVRFLFI